MDLRDPSPGEVLLLNQACQTVGLDAVWKGNVLRLHLRTDQEWRDKCCGSLCEPCVQQLARAVDEFRRLVENPARS